MGIFKLFKNKNKQSDDNRMLDKEDNKEVIGEYPEIQDNENKVNEDNIKDRQKATKSSFTKGFSKTSNKFMKGIGILLLGKKEINEGLLDELEELLVTTDMGIATVTSIIDRLKKELSRKNLNDKEEFIRHLKRNIVDSINIDNGLAEAKRKPYVIVVVGINGSGKTTTIAKMGNMFKEQGLSCVFAAGDTFRAAAVEQLEIWANRIGIPIVKQKTGSDPAAVIFDAVQFARARKYDIVIVDTAGRLHTKTNLMDELKKIVKVVKKEVEDAPHEILLVLDATTGQNALNQARTFNKEVGITGIILTKLDGTAKGGVTIGIINELSIPIKFVCFGEKVEDLKSFEAESFIDALFDVPKFTTKTL